MKKILIIILASLSFSALYAGTIRQDTDEQKYLDLGKRFFCVKKLTTVKQYGSEQTDTIHSCVILNKHWCITAAHIVQENFDFAKIEIDDKEYVLDAIVVHRDFDPKLNISDIALGFCKDGFDNIQQPILNKEKIQPGQVCLIAGFGKYGEMKKGATTFDGKIRAGSNRVEYRYNDMLICEASEKNQTNLEFLPNIGDTGGGLFVNGKLTGITCLILGKNGKANSTYGDEAGFIELYKYIEWIEENVQKTEM